MPETPTEKRPFLLRPRSKKPGTTKAKADWLVMAYLAADNDLEGELLADLAEMGSRPGVVEILAQVDRSPGHDASKGNWHGTRRYYVTRGEKPRRITSRLLADLGPTNTGDPGVLESYMRFGTQRYPAKATALILMNHGSGFYVPPEMPHAARRRSNALARPPRSGAVAGSRFSTPLTSTCSSALPRAEVSPTMTGPAIASTTRS